MPSVMDMNRDTTRLAACIRTCRYKVYCYLDSADWHRRPEAAALHTDRYDYVRDVLGDMEVARCRGAYWDCRDHSELLPFDADADDRILDDLWDMLKPEKHVHAEGCLHSDKPEMIICCSDEPDSTRDMEEGPKGNETSKLATGLYFKRCDGSYKNAAGEKLEIGKD